MLQSNVNISTDISLLKWQTSLKTHHRRFYMFILSTHKSMYFHRKMFFLFIAEASIIYHHSKSFAFDIRIKIQKWILYQKLDFDKSNFAMFLFQYSDCIYAYCNMFFFTHSNSQNSITIRIESHAGNLQVKPIQKCHLGTNDYRVFT